MRHARCILYSSSVFDNSDKKWFSCDIVVVFYLKLFQKDSFKLCAPLIILYRRYRISPDTSISNDMASSHLFLFRTTSPASYEFILLKHTFWDYIRRNFVLRSDKLLRGTIVFSLQRSLDTL